ncbi:MAG TPA: class I SAM-dependent methyltransferase [Acidimicrobiales bacterium]|nr:class I SAM-dependent methyltransferase [Acidimicrobiales bacterium]
MVFLDPVPADLGRYYPPDYWETEPDYAAFGAAERYKIDIVSRAAPAGRLLEIGPGNGGFSWLAVDAGYEVEVVERSPEVCRTLRSGLGVRAIQGDASPATLRGLGPYDAVAMWHVIEHVTDPRGLLEAAAATVMPGGAVVVATPNPRSLQFRLLGGRWPHLDAPRHVALIPPATLVGWAGVAGLRAVELTFTDDGSLGWNQFGWSEWLVRLAPDRVRREPGRLPARLLRRAGRELARLLAPVERRDRRGATYTAVFRRPATD